MDMTMTNDRAPAWLWVAGGLGVAWNVFGVVQFAQSIAQTQESLMMSGMTAAQAALYFGLPVWMKAMFAIGVFGGLAGSVALLLRRRSAVPIFLASLIGYVALWTGDNAYGLFAIMAGQMIVLTLVVAIAVALYATAWVARKRGVLTRA